MWWVHDFGTPFPQEFVILHPDRRFKSSIQVLAYLLIEILVVL